MNFMKHSELLGKHAFLGASNYHWINYSEDKLAESYRRKLATLHGTELHEFAAQCIRLGQNLPNKKLTLNMYVNDAIGFHMTPEQPLYFSENCFGTADAISFRDKQLRVHDLKTGSVPASMNQTFIYTALFCLEYRVKPNDIYMENRIYQSDDILIANPEPEAIMYIMERIKTFDKIINHIKLEE